MKEVTRPRKKEFDIEEYKKAMEHLWEKVKRVIRPEMQRDFMLRVRRHFLVLMDEAEMRAKKARGPEATPTEEEYKKVVDEFSLLDLGVDLDDYAKEKIED